MIDLEKWVVDVLEGIKTARELDVSEYKLILDKEQIKVIADAYDKTDWIEIY